MKLISIVSLILLLVVAASCDKHEKAQTVSSKDILEQNVKAHEGRIIDDLLCKEQDPSINFIIDIENGSLIAVFNEIPGQGPYRVETMRFVQDVPHQYLPALEQETVLNSVRSNGLQTTFGILMMRDNYLLGERVMWRILSQEGEVLKEVICCPNPVIIKNESGDQIMEAALLSICRPTLYALVFPPRNESLDYLLTTGTKQFSGKIPAGDLKIAFFKPLCAGLQGGITQIEVHYNNQSYQVELPWGYKMLAKMLLCQKEVDNSVLQDIEEKFNSSQNM